eukprot:1193137-Prorocentrum_minimum.AAC.3
MTTRGASRRTRPTKKNSSEARRIERRAGAGAEPAPERTPVRAGARPASVETRIRSLAHAATPAADIRTGTGGGRRQGPQGDPQLALRAGQPVRHRGSEPHRLRLPLHGPPPHQRLLAAGPLKTPLCPLQPLRLSPAAGALLQARKVQLGVTARVTAHTLARPADWPRLAETGRDWPRLAETACRRSRRGRSCAGRSRRPRIGSGGERRRRMARRFVYPSVVVRRSSAEPSETGGTGAGVWRRGGGEGGAETATRLGRRDFAACGCAEKGAEGTRRRCTTDC